MTVSKTASLSYIIAILAAVCQFDDTTRELVTQNIDAILGAIAALTLVVRRYTSSPMIDGILGWFGVKKSAK